tara:strand:- start:880 stop:1326 length:447 start_codon:yes stop_codon:yes gene_type:complete
MIQNPIPLLPSYKLYLNYLRYFMYKKKLKLIKMPTIQNLKLVTVENMHILIPEFINENQTIIGGYEDIMNVVLRMIKAKYFFNMDKNILRGCLEDLTYMYCPGDDVNKDRVVSMLEPSDDEDDDMEDGIEDIPVIRRNSIVNGSDVEV